MTPGESSVPKIQVSGDFKLGNVSGQAAIGENIVQTVFKDCTFILPDGSDVHGKSWLYTQGIRPTTDPANIFGRQQELGEIEEFFKDSPALVITGFRGTGKSTLASMYIDRLEKRDAYAGIYWRRVDETIDISDVVSSFFTIIGKPIKDIGQYKIGDQLNLLFRELNAAPYFLVLDNFEILLNSQTNVPLKPGFSELIEKANERGAGRSRVLFTSWDYPASERGIRPKCYPIGGIDEPAAIQLLRRNSLTEPDNELKKAIELSGGHPLALILLVQLVKEGAEMLSNILAVNTLWLGEKGEVAERILDKVYTERLDPEERRLLQYISLFREPVPSSAIAAISNDPGWTEAVIKKIALNLNRKSLLQKTDENYWEESLIQTYMYIKIFNKEKRHVLAYQYYLSLPIPKKRTNKEDLHFLIEAYYHACMAKEYDKAASIIFDNVLFEYLYRWGNYRTLVELYVGVLPKDHFRDKPLLKEIRVHAGILGNLGNVYRVLGKVSEAIRYYEKALEITRKIGDRRNEGATLGELGNAYSCLGDTRKAIEYYERALKIAQEIGDRQGEDARLGNLGIAYSNLGDVKKAIVYYEKALKIAQEIGNRQGECVKLGNIGLAYCVLGETRKAIGYYEKALEIAREIGSKHSEGIELGRFGSAYHELGDVKRAIVYYEKALKIAQEIGDRQGAGAGLGNLGNAYRDLGELRKAIGYYEEALKITQEIGDKQGESAEFGNLGLAYNDLGDLRSAIMYYEKALRIAQEIGNRQSEAVGFGNLGLAYRGLDDSKKAVGYYKKALKIAQEIEYKRAEGAWLSNIGDIYKDEKKYKEALACYLLAKDIFIKAEDRNLETTESSLKNLKEELGEKEFEQLEAEVGPKKEEIIKKMLKEIDE
ncbi:MAG: tetratricopeptide repeat protein [Planctomycetes bacterium]|nr:tetratricopeptide repeat protein [Planctomycetota bacterium]MDO8094972.1 tetratricopeptide repeat protein [Candidatus Brocadiales bacterium]